jgi:riboflavin synthase
LGVEALFTGIVEEVGEIEAVEELEGARRFRICAETVLEGLAVGGSVAIDGACHTALEVDDDGFTVESIGTTLGRTLTASYSVGSQVNLERAAHLGARLDGHLVQGHVDGIGELVGSSESGEYRLLDFRIPEEVWRQTILHGSISLNGISLTVNALEAPDICQVAIIPYTWLHTNLSGVSVGEYVNVEGDLVGKYVARMLPGGESR